MKVSEVIVELKRYNPNAEVSVNVNSREYDFSFAYGYAEGCTEKTCETVSFYIDELNRLESEGRGSQ